MMNRVLQFFVLIFEPADIRVEQQPIDEIRASRRCIALGVVHRAFILFPFLHAAGDLY